MIIFKKHQNILLFILLACATKASAATNNFQDLQQIRLDAQNYLSAKIPNKNENTQILISSIDARLKLKSCQTPLKFEIYGKQDLKGRITLKANCPTENWFLYLGAKIKQFTQVIAASHGIPRNTYLMPKHLKLIEKDIGELYQGYFVNAENLIGAKTTKSLTSGETITPYSIKLQQLVTKGDKVSIIATAANLEVKMPGLALQSGNLGQQVAVRNIKSGREIQAVVIGKYQVSVDY